MTAAHARLALAIAHAPNLTMPDATMSSEAHDKAQHTSP